MTAVPLADCSDLSEQSTPSLTPGKVPRSGEVG